jgi:hypothetical protein
MDDNTDRYDIGACFSLLPTFRVMPDNGTRIAFHNKVLSLGPQYEQCKTDRSQEMRCRCTPSVGKPVIGSMLPGSVLHPQADLIVVVGTCPLFIPIGIHI